MRPHMLMVIIYLFISLVMTACGGGGGGTASETPDEGSSNWDELVWDRDSWG